MFMGDCKNAANNYLLALKHDPELENAYLNLGGAYECLGESESAINILKEGLELNPKNKFNFYLNLGSSYSQKSVTDFKKGVKKMADSQISKDYYELNLSEQYFYESLLNEERAIHYLEKAIDVNPNHESPYVNLGVLYKWKAVMENKPNHFHKAIEYFNKSIEINPYNPNPYINRGNTYALMGKHALAINDYSLIVIMIEPKDVQAYLARGVAYKEIGYKDRAKADLQKVLKISKDPEFIQIAEKQLRELER
jgi:tetratricopeptide (TPR) repeat protein